MTLRCLNNAQHLSLKLRQQWKFLSYIFHLGPSINSNAFVNGTSSSCKLGTLKRTLSKTNFWSRSAPVLNGLVSKIQSQWGYSQNDQRNLVTLFLRAVEFRIVSPVPVESVQQRGKACHQHFFLQEMISQCIPLIRAVPRKLA